VLKDRLYTHAAKSQSRRSAQTALYRVTHALLHLTAPILAFTCEEAWAAFPKAQGDHDTIHVGLFPTPEDLTHGIGAEQLARLANWDRILAFRDLTRPALEKAQIGASLAAKLVFTVPAEDYALLASYSAKLPAIFITSQVELKQGESTLVVVLPADGVKCERCWKFTLDVGSDPKFPTACAPCAAAVTEMFP